MEQGTIRLKTGLAEMLKGGVIMDVTTPEQQHSRDDCKSLCCSYLLLKL